MRSLLAAIVMAGAVDPEASLLHEEFLSCQGSWQGSIPFPHVVGKGVVSGVSLEVSYDTCDAVKHFQLGQDPCSGDKPAALVRGALISKSAWVPKSTWDLYKSTFDCDKPRVTGICDKIIGLPVCFLAVQLNTMHDRIAVEVAACVDRHAKMCSPWATVWTRSRTEAAEGEDHAQPSEPAPTPKPWSREDAGEDALDSEIEPPERAPPPEMAQKIRGLVEAIRLLQEEKDVWEAGWRVGYETGKNESSIEAVASNSTDKEAAASPGAAPGVGPGVTQVAQDEAAVEQGGEDESEAQDTAGPGSAGHGGEEGGDSAGDRASSDVGGSGVEPGTAAEPTTSAAGDPDTQGEEGVDRSPQENADAAPAA